MLQFEQASRWQARQQHLCHPTPNSAQEAKGLNKSIGHLKFTPIVLSTDAKFFEILVKTLLPRKFLMLTKISHKFAYAHLSHDCIESPVDVSSG